MRSSVRRAGACAAIVALFGAAIAAMAQTGPAKSTPLARPATAPKAMTNADVVKMVQGDLGDAVIAMAIHKAARTAFDLTADGLLQLKRAGVSSGILRVMLDPTATPEPVSDQSPPAPPPLSPLTTTTAVPPAATPTTSPIAPSPDASGRAARREPVVEQSARLGTALGGTTFTIAKPYDRVYDAVLNYLKQKDQLIDSANRETGQIMTALGISGGYSQTGRRVQVILTRLSDTATTVKVAITLQRRKKLLQTEPWSDPHVDATQSEVAAKELQTALGETQ